MQECKNDFVLQEDLEIIASNHSVPWNVLENSSILVTGATGLIGSQLVKALACRNRLFNSNIKIFANVRDEGKAKKIFNDILNRTELVFVVGNVANSFEVQDKIDFIVHAASVTSSKEFVQHPVEVIDTTLNGTKNIMELAKKNHSKGIVYLSSMEAFGVVSQSNKRAKENDLGFIDLTSPRSCYPEGKRMAECLCVSYAHEYKVPVKIARLSQTFGAGINYSENRVFAQFAKSAIEHNDIVLHTRGLSWGNYCYTRDTIIAILMLLSLGNNGEAYTITNEESNIQIKDMANMVASQIANGKINVIFDIPESSTIYGYAPDTELHLSSAKMRSLGWQPSVSLLESYKRMILSMVEGRE